MIKLASVSGSYCLHPIALKPQQKRAHDVRDVKAPEESQQADLHWLK